MIVSERSKTALSGKDRRVTTVVEQQTWEDMEDDYEETNEKNIVFQYEQMKNSNSSNPSPGTDES